MHTDLTVGHLLHLLIQGPCVSTVHVNMVVSHIFNLASPSIHSDQLVEDVIVHDTLLELQLVQDIIGCLDVA